MGHPLLERLNYYPERRRWRLRYPVVENGKRRYLNKHFGPRASEGDQEAYATAVLEASIWLDQHEQKQKNENDFSRQQGKSRASIKAASRAAMQTATVLAEAKAGGQVPELSARLKEATADFDRHIAEHKRLNQPQLRLLERIAELEPIAAKVEGLAAEAGSLREENEHLRAIVAAHARAAATATGPLDELVEQFISSKTSSLKAKGRHPKTMTPIRTSSQALVNWLKNYSPSITTSAELEACPRALSDFWDEVMEERYGGKSAGWARKRLAGPRSFCEYLTARGYLGAMPRSIGRDWMAVGKDEPNPTPFNVDQIRMLWKHADADDIQLGILLGVNCGYRESDIHSLERSMIDFRSREIRRTRHKTRASQCHKLWPETASILKAHCDRTKGDLPLANLTGISLRLTLFIDSVIKGNSDADKRTRHTAKSLRDTASQLVEDITEGDRPHLVKQMLGHKDNSLSSHYRKVEYKALYRVIDKMRATLDLKSVDVHSTERTGT